MNLCDSCIGKCKFKNITECRRYDQMTNEEWFCGLSTEEKAEFLSNSGMFESYNEALFWLKEM